MRKASEIRKDMQALFQSAAKLQAKIHEIGLECIAHAQEHGDITLADSLVKGLEENAQGQRTETLKAWFTKYSPIVWNGKGEVVLLKDDNTRYTPFDVEAASAEPYYSMGKERKPVELTYDGLVKTVNAMLTRIEKAEAGEGNVTIKEGEDVTKMKTLAKRVAMAANSVNTTAEVNDEPSSEEDGMVENEAAAVAAG